MKNIIKILAAVLLVLTGCSTVQQSLDKNITRPILKNDPKLIYPIAAQQKNIEGTVSIMFIISKDGKVGESRLYKSSGNTALDLAAENYCKQLEFIPAKENGIPISSTMKWDVQFNLKDLSLSIRSKIREVKSLYSDVEDSKGKERQNLENEILAIHDNCLKDEKDGLKINEYIYAVVKPSIKKEWESLANNLPLTFLLYHDFIKRFKDYDSLNIVKAKMEMALKQDLQLLNQPYNFTKRDNRNKDVIIQKIKSFFELNYPEINLRNLDLKIKNDNNNLS